MKASSEETQELEEMASRLVARFGLKHTAIFFEISAFNESRDEAKRLWYENKAKELKEELRELEYKRFFERLNKMKV